MPCARHQDHRHQIDTIAMRAFRRRATDAVARIDAELVCLDIPARRSLHLAGDPGQARQQPATSRLRRRPRARSARTSVRGRRARRCTRPAASAPGAALPSTRPPARPRSRHGGGVGNGRRRADTRPAAAHPSSVRASRSADRSTPASWHSVAASSTAWPGTAQSVGKRRGGNDGGVEAASDESETRCRIVPRRVTAPLPARHTTSPAAPWQVAAKDA